MDLIVARGNFLLMTKRYALFFVTNFLFYANIKNFQALRALMQSRYDPESALAEHHDEIASASRRQGNKFSSHNKVNTKKVIFRHRNVRSGNSRFRKWFGNIRKELPSNKSRESKQILFRITLIPFSHPN